MSDDRILLHTCCAPCLSGARIGLHEEGIPFTSYWFNPNIQPLIEHDRRLSTFKDYVEKDPFDIFRLDLCDRQAFVDSMEGYLKESSITISGMPIRSRCDLCYFIRLFRTANEANKAGMRGFSTTLLLSKYQKHDRIKAVGDLISSETGSEFLYIDLRKYWGGSLDASRKYRLYRQNYCGCELSAIETRGIIKVSESVQKESQVRVEPCDQYHTENRDG